MLVLFFGSGNKSTVFIRSSDHLALCIHASKSQVLLAGLTLLLTRPTFSGVREISCKIPSLLCRRISGKLSRFLMSVLKFLHPNGRIFPCAWNSRETDRSVVTAFHLIALGSVKKDPIRCVVTRKHFLATLQNFICWISMTKVHKSWVQLRKCQASNCSIKQENSTCWAVWHLWVLVQAAKSASKFTKRYCFPRCPDNIFNARSPALCLCLLKSLLDLDNTFTDKETRSFEQKSCKLTICAPCIDHDLTRSVVRVSRPISLQKMARKNGGALGGIFKGIFSSGFGAGGPVFFSDNMSRLSSTGWWARGSGGLACERNVVVRPCNDGDGGCRPVTLQLVENAFTGTITPEIWVKIVILTQGNPKYKSFEPKNSYIYYGGQCWNKNFWPRTLCKFCTDWAEHCAGLWIYTQDVSGRAHFQAFFISFSLFEPLTFQSHSNFPSTE